MSQPMFVIPSIGFNGITRDNLIAMQQEDPTLANIRQWASKNEKGCFYKDRVLMCFVTNYGLESHVVALPSPLRDVIMRLVHSHSGHFGIGVTRTIINRQFTWPNLYKDVTEFIKSCCVCQKFSKSNPAKAPFVQPEIISKRFEKLAMDVIGPLDRSQSGFLYILTALDLATNFVFALPMRGYTASETAANLLKIISVIGVPATILTDQGPNFLSKVMDELCSKLAISRLKTTPYHPETNGQLESGYTPYELVFGKSTPNIIATLKSHWTNTSSPPVNVSNFMEQLQYDLKTTIEGLKERLHDKVVKNRELSDKHTKLRVFQPGDLILRKIPGLGSSLSSSWERPYKVIARISDVNYKIGLIDGKSYHVKIIHINQMKKFVEDSSNPCYKVLAIIDNEGIANDSLIPDSFKVPDLSPSQKKELDSCFSKYLRVFSDLPGCTTSASHKIKVSCDKPLWSPAYVLPLNVEDKFREELNSLLAQGIITESDSHWCSPPLPVRKKDGSIRIVVDYRKLNQVTEDEPFYMPSTEEISARLGAAHCFSKLDLAKGFHQIPMAKESRKYTAFACKFGKFEYLKMPFGLKNAPATFQLLMQRCLAGLEAFSSPYIDDIIVYSSDWSCHMFHIA